MGRERELVKEGDCIDGGLWERNVCSVNVNNLIVKRQNKITEIEVTLEEEKIDILLLQETKLSDEVDGNETFIEGYVEVRQVRVGRGGGGVSIYLKNGIGIVSSKGFSNGWMEVLTVQTMDTMYINIYKSPGIEVEKLKEGLEFIYKEIEGKDVDLVIAGDINLPRLGRWSPIELAEARTRIVNSRGDGERDGATRRKE